MPLEHCLEMHFERAHVQEPVLCHMARQWEHVMFNIDALSVGSQRAMMRIALVGEQDGIDSVIEYFKSLDVDLKTLSKGTYDGEIPDVPMRMGLHREAGDVTEKKLWLTVLGTLRTQPFLWALTRRFDVTYKIMQSVTGDSVSIVSMLIWGPRAEVNGAIAFLREQNVHVEFGEVTVGTPFIQTG